MNVEAVPVTMQHWDLLSALFAASSGVNRCWCMWPLRPPRTFRPDEVGNRAAMKALLSSGESPGLIALTHEKAVGWCAVGPRDRYPQYEQSNGRSGMWAIPCIYIEPTADREAIASVLIEAAVELAQGNGATALEGPPSWWLPGDEAAIALATATFLANGFAQIGPGARMPELRRMLD